MGETREYRMKHRPPTARVIEFVNKCREMAGREPLDDLVPGIPGNGCRCPIANSIGGPDAEASIGLVCFSDDAGEERFYVDTPEYVDEWQTNFDEGRYPEFIAPERRAETAPK